MKSENLGGSLLSCHNSPVRHLHRGFQPPFDVEQDPGLAGVVSDRFQHQIVGNAVEEGPDVEIEYPVLLPATLTSPGQGVMGTAPRTVAVAVGVEDRLQLLFQQHRCRGLGNSVCRIGHAQNPRALAVRFRDLDRAHRRREVASRREPVPELEQAPRKVPFEVVDRLLVNAGGALVRLDPPIGLPNGQLGDLKRLRLRLAHRAHPTSPRLT